MERVIFLFLRRMRVPLMTLILAYAISVLGFVLIPGMDANGVVQRVDFFHAFYFVSYTASTIGFGEIPYEFTPAQRMWVVFTIYLTVPAWFFAIGKIFALLQDTAFTRAMTEARFIYAVRKINEPFLIVCGYGETGSLLVRSLTSRNIQCVVIDRNPNHINDLHLDELPLDVPAFCGDASETQHLREAGLRKSLCAGVVAVTDNDDVNVKIAVTSKLLRPEVQVVCRASSREAVENLASFNTDHIINPYEAFAEQLGMAVRTPSVNDLHRWLVARPGRKLAEPLKPPKGLWVVCGFGRFGQAVQHYLEAEDIEVKIIESDENRAPEGAIVGSGTDSEPLRQASIESAAGIVAGTDNDANNLSIIMTARELNPDLFLVARQDRRADSEIFQAARLNLVMEPSRIIVWRILPLVTEPLLAQFLEMARGQTELWAYELLRRLREMNNGRSPLNWSVRIDDEQAPAVNEAIRKGQTVTITDLLREPRDRDIQLPGMPLLLVRRDGAMLLPDPSTPLRWCDELLFSGPPEVADRMSWVLLNHAQLEFVLTGCETPDGLIWRWWTRRKRGPAQA